MAALEGNYADRLTNWAAKNFPIALRSGLKIKNFVRFTLIFFFF